MVKRLCLILLCFLICLLPSLQVRAATSLCETSEPITIVIDPGHGGENEGTIENGFLEKEMDLITAQAMYEELIKFDNIQVYMSRTEDTDLTLKERAEFAKSVDADFLFSIHYNASGNHTLFGSEVWIPSKAPYNAYGYQFGYSQMLEMQEMGLYLRGIKTRLNDKGTDYYGIIRECVKLSIPAVIIEHCHVDEDRDVPFCDSEEDWIAFGKADAHAVARYFGLSSSILNMDYTEEAERLPQVDATMQVLSTLRDETEPDVCRIELLSADYDTGFITVDITAADYDSPLLYYDYSLDGGKSFSHLRKWPEVDVLSGTYKDRFNIKLQIPSGYRPEIILRAYNLADLYTESNLLSFPKAFHYGQDAEKNEVNISTEQQSMETPESEPVNGTDIVAEYHAENTVSEIKEVSQDKLLAILEICLVIVIILFIIVLFFQILYYRARRLRFQRKKDAGDDRYQPR